MDRTTCAGAGVRAASPKTSARACLGGTAVFRWSGRSRLRPADEPLVLLQEALQPRVVVLPEEMRHHASPGHAIAEQIVGQQGPDASCAPDRPRSYFA